MKRWRVHRVNAPSIDIDAEAAYVAPQSGVLMFFVAKPPDQQPAKVPGKKGRPRKPENITVRAFNAHTWTDMEQIA